MSEFYKKIQNAKNIKWTDEQKVIQYVKKDIEDCAKRGYQSMSYTSEGFGYKIAEATNKKASVKKYFDYLAYTKRVLTSQGFKVSFGFERGSEHTCLKVTW